MRTHHSLSLKPLCLAALLCAACAARADIQVYTNAADFMSAASAPGIDTYDDLRVQQYGRDAAAHRRQLRLPGVFVRRAVGCRRTGRLLAVE
ncbi:hypothetical protein [Massilia phosphatilytica]